MLSSRTWKGVMYDFLLLIVKEFLCFVITLFHNKQASSTLNKAELGETLYLRKHSD